MDSTYVLKFDNAPTTRVDKNFEAAAELVDFYKQRRSGQEELTMTNCQELSVVGVNLLTKWTLELNQLAGGAEPPEWLVQVKPAFIRKCLVKKFHKALG